MRVINTSAVVVQASQPKATGRGGFKGPNRMQLAQERARKSIHPANTEYQVVAGLPGGSYADPNRILPTKILWNIYLRVPDVRASVDSIVRRVATNDWTIGIVEGSIDPDAADAADQRKAALESARVAERWLQAPLQAKTWQQFLTMFGTDLLVYDQGVAEKNLEGGQLKELVPVRGDDFWPITDEHGSLTGYEQHTNGKVVDFDVDDLVVTNLFCNTTSPRGLPLIESIVNEVVSITKSAQRTMSTMDVAEIPPGFLYLTGVSGQAAEDTLQSFVKDAGKDSKLRVLHFPNPKAGSAEWVSMDYSPKELSMVEVIEQVRRTIWRTFGVFPVEMGATDGMPRASAQVQLDASSSHLLRPVLELLQQVMTSQVLPLLIEPEWEGVLEFRFDFTRDLTPQEEKDQADADATLVKEGIVKRNEIRARRGLPPEEAGEALTTSTPVHVLGAEVEEEEPPPAPQEPEEDDDDPDDDPDDDGGPGEVDGDDTEEPDDTPPGDVEASAPGPEQRSPACRMDGETSAECVSRKVPEILDENPGMENDQAVAIASSMCETSCSDRGCTADHQRAPFAAEDLPSAWQPEGRFKDVRALNLGDLGSQVSRYQRTVEPIWEEARTKVITSVRAAYSDQEISPEEAARVLGDVSAALDVLALRWEGETGDQYRAASQIGLDFAERQTGVQPLLSGDAVGDAYRDRAMGWLVGPDGPLENIRARITVIMGAVSRCRPMAARAPTVRVPDGVEPGMTQEALLAAVGYAFDANEHRISNWSGKLVELANSSARDPMVEASTDDAGDPVVWMVEWANAGGDVCPTCDDLGTRGFVEASQLSTVPGGETECRANCRCVLVWWTRSEVENGDAVLLGAGNTGEDL